MTLSVFRAAPNSPPSPSGCCGANKSGTALARPAPFLRPLPPRPPPPHWKVSGGRGSRVWPWWSCAQRDPFILPAPRLALGPSDRVHGNSRDLGGNTGPRRTLDLKPLCLRREEAGEEPTSPVTQVLQLRCPEECKMFACAKLACTPALVRSPDWARSWRARPLGTGVHVVEWVTSARDSRPSQDSSLTPLKLCDFLSLSFSFVGFLTSLLPSILASENRRGLVLRPSSV